MEIRKECNLIKYYGHTHPINATSPDVLFMNALCEGRVEDVKGFFREKKLFGNKPPVVDCMYGRYEGLDGIEEFARGWLSRFQAESAYITPVVQTIANGRVVLETVVNFVVDGAINQVPMFVVGDFRTSQLLEEVRMYCHFSFVPDLQAYRKPMFVSAHLETGDPGLLTGAVGEYYEALHHSPAVDVERILETMGENCIFGGYEGWGSDCNPHTTREDLRRAYEGMATYIPRCVGMRYETIIDDGKTCVIEWQHIVTKAGWEERHRIAISAISAYERGEDGKLCSIRICDYAGFEKTIDWSKVPDATFEEARSINYVESYSPYIGVKKI